MLENSRWISLLKKIEKAVVTQTCSGISIRVGIVC